MKASIQKIGSSAALLLSEPTMAAAGVAIGDEVDVTVVGTSIIVRPKGFNPREGWAEDSKRIAALGDDKLVWPEFDDDPDNEWTW